MTDLESTFDYILKRTVPYLILIPPSKLRDNLADLMRKLYHSYRERNETYFNELCSTINETIKNRESFESRIENNIFEFESVWLSFDQRLTNLSRELIDLREELGEIKKLISKRRKAPIQKPCVEPCVEKSTYEELSEKEKSILGLIRANPNITHKEMGNKFGKSEGYGKYYTDRLRKIGLLKRVGADRRGSWVVIEKDEGGKDV